MGITASNITTKGAVVTVGGSIKNNPDADGYYWDTVSGTDVGCTAGGVTITFSYEKKDIYCDQTLPPVAAALTGETAEVDFSMLESEVANLKYALNVVQSKLSGTENKLQAGGSTNLSYIPVKLEVPHWQTGLLTTYTFFRTLSNGFEMNFERDNPTLIKVKFTAYADTTHPSGQQLFSVRQALV